MDFFKITIGGIPSPQGAFVKLVLVSETEKIPIKDLERRWFKMILRPADILLDEFIDGALEAARASDPVSCIREGLAWTFFGVM